MQNPNENNEHDWPQGIKTYVCKHWITTLSDAENHEQKTLMKPIPNPRNLTAADMISALQAYVDGEEQNNHGHDVAHDWPRGIKTYVCKHWITTLSDAENHEQKTLMKPIPNPRNLTATDMISTLQAYVDGEEQNNQGLNVARLPDDVAAVEGESTQSHVAASITEKSHCSSSIKSSANVSSLSGSSASPFDILQYSSTPVAHRINRNCENMVRMIQQNPDSFTLAAAQQAVVNLQDAIRNAPPQTTSSLQHSGTTATLSSSSNTRSE